MRDRGWLEYERGRGEHQGGDKTHVREEVKKDLDRGIPHVFAFVLLLAHLPA